VISSDGLRVDPEKVKAVVEWKRSTSEGKRQREIFNSFLGGYYRRFVEGFSKLALPLTQLTQKGSSSSGWRLVTRVSRS